MAKRYKIHPSIGVARLGRSTEWYPGPMTPGVMPKPAPDGSYRDAGGFLRAQGAVFWVFEYDDADGGGPNPIEAGPGKAVAKVEWTVHLANKKAFWFEFHGLTGSKDVTDPPGYGYGPTPDSWRNKGITDTAARRSQLIIDFGPRKVNTPGSSARFDAATAGGYRVTGPGPGTLRNAAGPADIDSLGTLHMQADGSLAVVPAPGVSASVGGVGIVQFANNPGWFDNTSDGPVHATLVFADGTRREVDDPSWVLVTPPDFAPAVPNVVSLQDLMFDVAVRHFGIRGDIYAGSPPAGVDDFTSTAPPFRDDYTPSYRDEIYPLISRPGLYGWVQKLVASRHRWDFQALATKPFTPPPGPHGQFSPAQIFARLRRPSDWNLSDDSFMPVLWGDGDDPTWLTLTPTQYHILRQWSLGRFDNDDWTWPVPAPAPSAVPKAGDLDRAALEACVGGAFYPGIEIGWMCREPRLYVQPFRYRFRQPSAGAGGLLGLDAGADPTALYPGDATKRMACPWQADFVKCNTHWWPAQRPDQVVTDSATLKREEWARNVGVVNGTPVSPHEGMVVNWHRLGVVVPVPDGNGVQAEKDRTLP